MTTMDGSSKGEVAVRGRQLELSFGLRRRLISLFVFFTALAACVSLASSARAVGNEHFAFLCSLDGNGQLTIRPSVYETIGSEGLSDCDDDDEPGCYRRCSETPKLEVTGGWVTNWSDHAQLAARGYLGMPTDDAVAITFERVSGRIALVRMTDEEDPVSLAEVSLEPPETDPLAFGRRQNIDEFIARCGSHLWVGDDRFMAQVCVLATSNGLRAWSRNDPNAPRLTRSNLESMCDASSQSDLSDEIDEDLRYRFSIDESGYSRPPGSSDRHRRRWRPDNARVALRDARILRPLQAQHVSVFNCSDVLVESTVSGAVSRGGISIASLDEPEASVTETTSSSMLTTNEESFILFPSEPGALRYTFKSTVGDTTYTTGLNYLVERRYQASIRVGAGINLARPLNGRDYGVEDGLIVDSSARNVELVVGLVPYLGRNGIPGRPHHTHYYTLAQRLIPDPYIGLAIVGTSISEAKGVDVFRAVYLGADWIVTPGFALTLAMRISRGERLRDDYEVGSRVAEGEDYTRQAAGFAPAIILSFYPRFFNFGKKG